MKKLLLLAVLLGLLSSPALGAGAPVLLSLPEAALADILQKCLPFPLGAAADGLGGTIAVERIDRLTLGDQVLTAAVGLSGREVQLNTSFGNQQIRLNVGNVDLSFNLAAVLRYDKASRTLFIRPTVTDLDQQGGTGGEVGKLIVALFNDQELPLTLDRLPPIVTAIGARQLTIDLVVDGVALRPGALDITLIPQSAVKGE